MKRLMQIPGFDLSFKIAPNLKINNKVLKKGLLYQQTQKRLSSLNVVDKSKTYHECNV